MEPGGSMTHSQGLSNDPYHEPNQPIDIYPLNSTQVNTYPKLLSSQYFQYLG